MSNRLRIVLRMLAFIALMLSTVEGGWAADLASPEASPSAGGVFPDTPVGGQVAWILAEFEDRAQHLTAADVKARFSPSFLQQVPAAEAVAFTQQFAAAVAPITYKGEARPPTDHQAMVLLEGGSGELYVLSLVVEPEKPYLIDQFALEQAPQPTPQPMTAPVEYSGLYDIGGRSLYLNCTGNGSPTVILESGYNTPTSNWLGIQTAFTPLTRVCTYDRANVPLGASDPAHTPRTGADVVTDLHALLVAAQVPGPYVLVGHSIGGIFARLYASAYPDDVAGLVLVDSSHEDQDVRLRALLTAEQQQALDAQSAGLPDAEGLDLEATFDEMRATRAATPLRSMPLFVLTPGKVDPSMYPAGYPIEADHQLQMELQADLVSLEPGAKQVIAENSGHFIQLDQPEIVIDAITQVVDAVRDPASWATPVAGR